MRYNSGFLAKMPHVSILNPPPKDKFSFRLPRSNLILECRRMPPGVWEIDVYNRNTAITVQNVYQNLSGTDFVALCELLIAKAQRYGLWVGG